MKVWNLFLSLFILLVLFLNRSHGVERCYVIKHFYGRMYVCRKYHREETAEP